MQINNLHKLVTCFHLITNYWKNKIYSFRMLKGGSFWLVKQGYKLLRSSYNAMRNKEHMIYYSSLKS